jgi:hypothetical protein
MYWNSENIKKDILSLNLPHLKDVEIGEPGGDYDTENITVFIDNTDECILITGWPDDIGTLAAMNGGWIGE